MPRPVDGRLLISTTASRSSTRPSCRAALTATRPSRTATWSSPGTRPEAERNETMWSLVWIRCVTVVVLIGVVPIMQLHSKQPVAAQAHATLADEGSMPELEGAVSWLNSAPLTRDLLRGKVVLVNF